ncbi:CARD-like protein [Singapore grouper iridovirus]|nr:CARD-like protein [Singapore grouper iridovirus]
MLKRRRTFIERSSESTVVGIIKRMQEIGVINRGEACEIMECNLTRADKARRIIDSVRKKGNCACTVFVREIMTIDQELAVLMELE